MKHLKKLITIGAALFLAGTSSAIGATPKQATPSQPFLPKSPIRLPARVLSFPKDHSVGTLLSCSQTIGEFEDRGKIQISLARGDVKVPANTWLRLDANWDGGNDTSWIGKLKPDDLYFLDLRRTPITDEGIASVSKFSGLRQLRLTDTDITDGALASLAKLKFLRSLTIAKTAVTGSGFDSVAAITSLGQLDAGHNALSNACLEKLKPLKNLQFLYLNATGISTGVKHLTALKSLVILALHSNKKITDECISSLKGLPNLLEITLDETSVTAKGLLQLDQQNPKLQSIKVSLQRLNKNDLDRLPKALRNKLTDPNRGTKVDPDLFHPLH